MNPFHYQRATDVADAIRAGQQPATAYLGGGTNLIDLMKGEAVHPQRLVDINRIDGPLAQIVPTADGGLMIGALVSNTDTANHPLVRQNYPILTQALLSGATAQLRNMATVGGNLLQRTRCYYFYDPVFTECNKRAPGSGCAAQQPGAKTRIHAILGASQECIAVNPSDMNVALAALDAVVHVQGPNGARQIPIGSFHRLPESRPDLDTTLQAGELITGVALPANGFAQYAHYLKIRDRTSYAFALVSVAALLEIQGGTVKQARIALGGVAHKPWRAVETEQMLRGAAWPNPNLTAAAAASLSGAKPFDDNRFKVLLAQRAIVRSLNLAGGTA